ncbi:hypothetical protein [Streptomyces sp. NPDC093598]|uniref:hypothetical protein n=1 Tax=Streptomyces sp. NPDC093598 TaxID=3366046 RepID=UPI0037FA15A0
MFRRVLLWSLLATYLIVIGLWASAAAPIVLALAGTATVLAAVPGSVWALAVGIAWLARRPAPVRAA